MKLTVQKPENYDRDLEAQELLNGIYYEVTKIKTEYGNYGNYYGKVGDVYFKQGSCIMKLPNLCVCTGKYFLFRPLPPGTKITIEI